MQLIIVNKFVTIQTLKKKFFFFIELALLQYIYLRINTVKKLCGRVD
jgi:hypothetical protein